MKTLYLILSLILVFAIGCNQQEAPVQTSLNNNTEIMALTKPPEASGPYVIRYEGTASFGFYDAKQKMFSYHSWENTVCEPGYTEMVFSSLQEITSPQDYYAFMQLVKMEDHFIWVWENVEFPVNCFGLAEANLVAMGRGNLVLTDNDVFAWRVYEGLEPLNSRVNSFGASGQGILDDLVNGGKVNYNATTRYVWRAIIVEDEVVDDVKLDVTFINLAAY